MEINKLAWRSIWRNRRRTAITLISVGVGLAVVIFMIAIGDGVYYQLVDDAARMQAGHITIESREYRKTPAVEHWVGNYSELGDSISEIPGVKYTKPLVTGQGVARTGRNSIGVMVIGVDPEIEKKASPIPDHIVKGEYLGGGDEHMIAVGSKLARQLKLEPGKKMVLTANDIDGVLVEELFRVKGIFHSGSDEIDGYLVQIPLETAASFFNLPDGAVTQLGVVVDDITRQDVIHEKVRRLVNKLTGGKGVLALSWQKVMPDLASYIQMDKTSNIIFQGLLMFLVLFTILNTILMSVLEREREFAVLMAVGTPSGMLRCQVILESVMIGLVGCAAGMLLGWGLSAWTAATGIDITSLFGEEGVNVSGFAVSTTVRPKVLPDTLLWPVGLVFASTILISFLSTRRIRDRGLADTLRHA